MTNWIATLERLARNAEKTADEFGDLPDLQERLRNEARELREIATYLRISPTADSLQR